MDKRNTRKRNIKEKKGKREMSANSRKCQYCGNEMRCRGASDSAGGVSWKCRNKKCGRTMWERKRPLAPEPLVPHIRRF